MPPANMRRVLLALCLGPVVACADTDLREPPPTVVVEFDPTASPPRLPTPTDLARDPATGRITIPLPPNASSAERGFAAYLESLDAFPPASHATATLTGDIEVATIDSNVIVIDLTVGGAPVAG